MRLVAASILLLISFSTYAQDADQKRPSKRPGFPGAVDSLPKLHISHSILLDEVTITGLRNYKADSIRLRKEFSSVFNHKPPSFKDVFITKNPNNNYPVPYYKAAGSTAALVSVDVLSIFGLLGKNKAPKSKLQKTLLKKENEDYIDQVFSKQRITELTGLRHDSLLIFMQKYRPTVADAQKMTTYELLLYIKKCYKQYTRPD